MKTVRIETTDDDGFIIHIWNTVGPRGKGIVNIAKDKKELHDWLDKFFEFRRIDIPKEDIPEYISPQGNPGS